MFRQLSNNDGLSNTSVTCLYRDSRGYLWAGTASGLNRYDSYTFQQYYQDTDSLPDNYIRNICEDWDGNIWITTSKDIALYNYQTGKFIPHCQSLLKRLNIETDTLPKIGIDSDRNFLWAYDKHKIYLYNHQQNSTHIYPQTWKHLQNLCLQGDHIYTMYNNGMLYSIDINSSLTQEIAIPPQYQKQLKDQYPSIYADRKGGLWIYTFQNSLLLYKQHVQSEWKEIKLPAPDVQFNRISKIAEDLNGNIWLITSHRGVFICQPQSGSLINLVHHPLQSHSIASNNLNTIHIDHEGIVWIGNFKQGISYHVPQAQIFLNQKLWQHEDILAFCEDSLSLWYGTDGGGALYQSNTDELPHPISTPANVIISLHKDHKGRIWMGCFQNGLICYDHGSIKQYTTKNSSLQDNNVYAIQEDKKGRIWIGTLNGHLQQLDPQSHQLSDIALTQSPQEIRQLLYDGDRTLYAATSSGLMTIDMETHLSTFIHRNREGKQALPKSLLYTLYKDSRNILWMGGTQGLVGWHLTTDKVLKLTQNNGLPANMVTAITEDNNGQIWAGTCNGIARINLTRNMSITNYNQNDGLTANQINERALYKLRNGNILAGTPNGYITIIPQETVHNSYTATVYLTGISPQYLPLKQMLQGKSPECANRIIMKEGTPFIQLEFSTLDFIEPRKVRYAYRLKELNSKWTFITSNRVGLPMLSPGEYTLEVKAYNSEYTEASQVKKITVCILPPWYKTGWAYLAYSICVLLIIAKVALYIHQRQKKKKIAANQERQQKITDMKMQFFANMSHELRTPLTLIINPLEEFLKQYPQYKNTLLYTVQNNAKYLLELINQLLDFRKLDANGESMYYTHGNIVALVKDQYMAFENIAQKRGIDYRFVSMQNTIQMDFDSDKVRKIVMNILSNAFKFTENQGYIEVKIDTTGDEITIQFTDTGCGIDAAQQKKIFECFYQADKPHAMQGGSGIGLYLVAEYVKMHKGSIKVSSNAPKGSIFTVTLPTHATGMLQPNCEQKENYESSTQETMLTQKKSYTILLIDDNGDFLDFLSASLSTYYNVLKSSNGYEALNILQDNDIDLVISDIMMPNMNGLELCQAVKNDLRTSHIPVILLTARAGEEYQLEGLNTGADDYITKPFSMEILKLRIEKLVENKLKKHELFNKEIDIEPSHITITPLDQQFVERAIHIVEENINDANFSVEQLATQLNISRGYLYKKLIKITGKTSLEFIRIIRMKRAQQLLAESQLQVAEIAYKLGYNSPKIFSRHFKEEFGISPSDFIRNAKNKNND